MQRLELDAGCAAFRGWAACENSGDQECDIRYVDTVVAIGIRLIATIRSRTACENSGYQKSYI